MRHERLLPRSLDDRRSRLLRVSIAIVDQEFRVLQLRLQEPKGLTFNILVRPIPQQGQSQASTIRH
jgi:hypothetical protein